MNLFSLDCSTASASACLMEDQTVIASSSWFEERARHEGLFAVAEKLLQDAGWTWDEIDRFTVGRGPGAYSGLRVSLLAAQALAAPGGQPVLAVSSMDALAMRLCREHQLDEITIIGDARRQSVWYGTVRIDQTAHTPTEWKVTPVDQMVDERIHPAAVATPHGDVLQELCRRTGAKQVIEGSQIPLAEDVAALSILREEAGAVREPLIPLYLHPAV